MYQRIANKMHKRQPLGGRGVFGISCAALTIALAFAANVAMADDPGDAAGENDAACAPDPSSDTCPDWDTAPLPNRATGIVVPRDRSQYAWRGIPRAALFLPRWVLDVSFALPRRLVWGYERYHVRERFMSLFFNDAETFGIFPTALIETGFGANFGARLIYRDVFGHGERLAARAGYGGRYRQIVSAGFGTGELFGQSLEVKLTARYSVQPRSRFFGLGNEDVVAAAEITDVIDPRTDDTAVSTRYRHDDLVAQLAVKYSSELIGLQLLGAFKTRQFDRNADFGDNTLVSDVYDTGGLIGYDTDLRNIYLEGQLSLDTRRTLRHYLASPAPSTGWHAVGFAGYQTGLADDPSSFGRWGFDVQRYINLWRGDRVLVLRAYAEGVGGRLSRIPFVDYPSLGGTRLLRGHTQDRFRDRYTALLTAEYEYPIQRMATGFVFVDGGKVWRSFSTLDADNVRLGFGFGIQFHTMSTYLGRIVIASSDRGGFQFRLSLNPTFTLPPRSKR